MTENTVQQNTTDEVAENIQNVPELYENKPQKNILLIFLIIIAILCLTGVVYLFLKSSQSSKSNSIFPNQQSDTNSNAESNSSSTSNIIIGSMDSWKTYNNSKFGFQIKYPDSWSIEEDENLQGLALITVTIIAPSENSFLDIWVRNGSWSEVENELAVSSTKTEINGIKGLVEPAGKGKVYTFPSMNGNRIIQVIYQSPPESSLNEIEILDQVLSTLTLE